MKTSLERLDFPEETLIEQFHLKSIGIENFRVFEKQTNFDLAPITILTGKNNSGKSSLIKLISLLKSSFEEDWKHDELNFRTGNHNLGTYKEASNWNRKNEPIAITLPIRFSCVKETCFITLTYQPNSNLENCKLKGFEVKLNNGDRLFSFETGIMPENVTEDENKQNDLKGHFISEIKIDFELLKKVVEVKEKKVDVSANQNESYEALFEEHEECLKFQKEYLSHQKEMNSSFMSFFDTKKAIPIQDENFSKRKYLIDAFIDGKEVTIENMREVADFEQKFIKKFKGGVYLNIDGYENEIHEKSLDWWFDIWTSFFKIPLKYKYSKLGYQKTNNLDFDFSEYGNRLLLTFFNQILRSSLKQLQGIWKSITYISSQRGNSDRLISNTNKHLDINSTIVEYFDKISHDKNSAKDFIAEYLKKFELGESLKIERIEGLVSRVYLSKNGKEILLSDLGYGFSQLLPILLKIKIASMNFKIDYVTPIKYYSGKIFIIEEPESNLHPDFQSMLADLFVEAAERFNVQFIIETHSEYLIRKLQYLTAKKVLKPRDTAIYYFYNPENIPEGEEQIKRIEIRDDGKLSGSFGKGFFDESSRLLLSLIDDKIVS